MAIDFRRMFKDAHITVRDDSIKQFWVNVNCPFCKNPVDTHFNGGFNYLNPRYNCWRCGGHSWYDALSLVLGIPTNQVNQYVKSYSYVSSIKEEKRIAQAEYLDLPGYRLSDEEKQYLSNRGFDPGYLQNKYHIRGGGTIGDWSYRIIIPVWYKNVLVSWTGRSILPKEYIKEHKIPRYKNLSIEQSVINIKEILFNLDNSTGDAVILVEGPMDVLKMGDNCICSLGTSVTRDQELFLKERYKKIFICFDNEYEAQNKARHLGSNLAAIGMDVEVVNICEPFTKIIKDDKLGDIVVPKNDPGELTYEEVCIIKKELGFDK